MIIKLRAIASEDTAVLLGHCGRIGCMRKNLPCHVRVLDTHNNNATFIFVYNVLDT